MAIDFSGGLTALQIKERNKAIGASEVAAVLGLSKWETPLNVFDRKTNPESNTFQGNDATWFGTQLEPIVAHRFHLETGYTLTEHEEAYKKGHLVAHIDRYIVELGIPLECKTQNAFAGLWEEVPDMYRVQTEAQMYCMGVNECYVAVIIGGQSYQHFHVTGDPELQQAIGQRVDSFWENHVLANIPPPPISYEDACRLYPMNRTDAKIATEPAINALKRLQQVNTQLKAFNAEKEALKLEICNSIEDAEGLMNQNGDLLCTWKLTNPKPKLDPKLMIEHLTEDEKKLSTIQPKGYRALKLKEKALDNT